MLVRALSTMGAILAAAALVMAVASVWLVLADPVAVANSVSDRGVQAFVEALAEVIGDALRQVARWL